MPTTMILNQLLKSGLNQAELKICFLTKDEVALTWENRHQNYSVVSVCEALRYMYPLKKLPGYSPFPTKLKQYSLHRGDCQDNLIMTSPGGWLELEEAPVFTKDGRRFAMALSANGYKQVSMVDVCKFESAHYMIR